MSQENVEIVRSMVEAFFDDDTGQAWAYFDPGAEYATTFVEGKTYAGLDGLLEYKATLDEVWLDWHPEDSRFVAVGEDRVAWLYRIVGYGKGSGVPIDQPVAIVWTLRHGLIWRGQGYIDHHEALKAVGLEE
jgi:ketosteroid isomerase-like protein